jgi:hypothetical protein
LTDTGGTPITGSLSMTFNLYTVASGGTAAWTETHPTVTVTNGVYDVVLGSVTPIVLASAQQYYLGVTAGTDPEMTPRQPLASVMSALFVDGINLVSGNVGIGTSNPQTKLHVAGTTRFELGSGSIDMSTPGGWPGMIAYSPNGHRRDIQFYDDRLTIATSSSSTPSSYDNGIQIFENGTTAVKVLQIIGGSDIAEPFEIAGTDIEPGIVVSIDSQRPGQLRIADLRYDRTVAGIISGAGGIRPGLTLQQDDSIADGTYPVAITGRVYCWVDAAYGPIEPGDLLTTSDTPGHAMKVSDYDKAQGAILGKAMSALDEGKGLVLVLVTLQ